VQGLPAESPTPASPVNYINARGALFIAAQMGCRLPTLAEWNLALAADRTEGGETQNLRDATFNAMHASIVGQFEPGPRRAWPHAQSYTISASGRAAGLQSEDILKAPPKLAPGSDGFVFFRPVASDSDKLTDLGGNVSEWVLAQDPGAEVAASMAGVNAAIANGESVRVVGASAVGDPEHAEGPGPPSVARGDNFSDVGFRLAFKGEGGGSGRLADQLVKVLAQVEYRSGAN
jgi:formylglycine-generating enzyme required for sulfatase activity